MKRSDDIALLAKALVAAQKELKPVTKDGTNPHFKNRYATLDALTEYVRPILLKHGIALLQGGDVVDPGWAVVIETTLMHESGQWISSTYLIPVTSVPIKNKAGEVIASERTPQTAGSAITYGRRYGLASILALTTEEDDDAEGSIRPFPRLQEEYSQTAPQDRPVISAKGVACPKCHSDMWDNRLTKKNPKAPDFKCKDPTCEGVIWPPKGGPDAQTKSNTEAVRTQLQTTAAAEESDEELPF